MDCLIRTFCIWAIINVKASFSLNIPGGKKLIRTRTRICIRCGKWRRRKNTLLGINTCRHSFNHRRASTTVSNRIRACQVHHLSRRHIVRILGICYRIATNVHCFSHSLCNCSSWHWYIWMVCYRFNCWQLFLTWCYYKLLPGLSRLRKRTRHLP